MLDPGAPGVGLAALLFLSTLTGVQGQTPGSSATSSAPVPDPEVVMMLERIREKHDVPGMIGAVLVGDRITRIGAAGVRKAGAAEKISIDDRMHLGSCTKAMTATLIGNLVEEGKLSWTTTIGETFPDLKERMHADYRNVTLEQLLAHRGGVPTDLDADGLWGRLWRHTGTPTEQRRTLLEGVVCKAPAVAPGKEYQYSNGGYAIAGHIAEHVVGKSWETLMQEKLFKPLGITTAGFGAPGDAGKIDAPWGHRGRKGALTPMPPVRGSDNPPGIGPAGTVHMSVGDWAKFVAVHTSGSKRPHPLLKPATVEKLRTPPPGADYALGWNVALRDWGGRVLTHAGSNTMWYCVTWASPEKDFAVLVACNAAHDAAPKACDEAAWELIQLARSGNEPSR